MVSIKAVGDIAAGDCTIDGIGIKSLSVKKGTDYFFEPWRSIFQSSDIVIGNLEGPLSERSIKDDLRLCGVPSFAGSLKRAGFNVLSVANNHMLDHGEDIFNETINLLNEQKIQIAGLRDESGAFHCKPVRLNINGLRIGILAYNWIGLPENPLLKKFIASIDDSIVNYTWNRDPLVDAEARKHVNQKNQNVHRDIKKLKKDTDYVILLPHWGIEWTHLPPYGVTLEAHSFIESGADLILGSHPHVIQGIENYMGKTIVYSLGNFIFDTHAGISKSGFCFSANIQAQDIDWSIIPFRPDKNFVPTPASGKKAAAIEGIIHESSISITAKNAHEILDDEKVYSEYESQYNKFKLIKSLLLLMLTFRYPKLIIPLFKKIFNLFHLIILRLRGHKIRW